MSYEDEDFDDDSGQESGSEPLRGAALDKSIRKDAGKSTSVGPKDVEEAVAQQLKSKDDPFPYRSGYGKTGEREAELVKYHQVAKKNGTTVPNALRDYASIEDAARQNPLLGIEAMAKRMGWNSRELALAYANQHLAADNGRQLGSAAGSHIIAAHHQAILDEASSHPANKHLRSQEGQDLMYRDMSQLMPDGRTHAQHMVEKIPDARQRLKYFYNRTNQALLTHKMAQLQNQRDQDKAYVHPNRAEAIARRIDKRLG